MLRLVWVGHVRRKPIEAWFVVLGQLGLVEVGVLRLVGLRYGRQVVARYVESCFVLATHGWAVMVCSVLTSLFQLGLVSARQLW